MKFPFFLTGLLMVLGASAPAGAQTAAPMVRVGFLPAYEPVPPEAEIARLTHLVYFSVIPGPELGPRSVNAPRVAQLRALTKAHQVKLLVSVGGANQSQGFAAQTRDPDARERFAGQLADFARDQDFDGVDIDWEYPASPVERFNYAAFIKVLSQKLRPARLLTVNMHRVTNYMQGVDPADLDWVQVMSYDQSKGVKSDPSNPLDQGSYTSVGQNGTYDEALEHLAFWVRQGFPPSKIVLGVPFYGNTLKDGVNPVSSKAYKDLLAGGNLDPGADFADGYYFNGQATIAKKCAYLKQNGFRGIMFWELGQDAQGDRSLLKTIEDQLK